MVRNFRTERSVHDHIDRSSFGCDERSLTRERDGTHLGVILIVIVSRRYIFQPVRISKSLKAVANCLKGRMKKESDRRGYATPTSG